MTEPAAPCPRTAALAPDVALGLLTGEERAESLAHVATCAGCRAAVDELAAVSDRLLVLAPTRLPPEGLANRVVAAVSAPRRRLPRRWVATAVAAAVVSLAAGLALGRLDRGEPEPFAARMVTPAGRDVGRVTVIGDSPAWVLVSVPAWERWDSAAPESAYQLRIELVDGRTVTLDGVRHDAAGNWASAAAVAPTDVRAVSVVDSSGRVWCRSRAA